MVRKEFLKIFAKHIKVAKNGKLQNCKTFDDASSYYFDFYESKRLRKEMIAVINRVWKEKKINFATKGGNMGKVTLMENPAGSGEGFESITIFIDNRRIGYLKRGGYLVFISAEEFSSLDLSLLNRISDQLRRDEIKRLQGLVKQLIKEGETLHD